MNQQLVDNVILMALAEDAPWGDITSDAFVPEDATATAVLNAREAGVASGLDVFARTFQLVDAQAEVTLQASDGDSFTAGQQLASVSGNARAVLRAERIALNLSQRMSGIATQTAAYVAQVAGTHARVVDTRKTTPGLRALERHAVRSGGGHNHRFSLSDAVMAKDNHLAVLAAAGIDLGEAIRQARARIGHTTHLEVEVDRLDQVETVVSAGVDTIMLDNFSLEDLRAGVELVAGRAIVEASGGVNLDTIAAIAATGVDVISVGALTHSVRSLDLGLDIAVSAAH
ncbi:carboxylating nicotinate-nucleotide diphosphorylase [Salinibacterium sp. NSLL150]|uniref:carboxylating nicotinate-nucleotide diphosphorylase n=1 Tax=unclassified Salinibacterium TaxID=2632331 RepID=UPI0018CE38F7|nr:MULTISPECIES: carboxylating nicotinate-nucleotide diphosphorylase [unclassified Salinibacterium]MBH0098927.1 carboxylating nicotinate-nucleotide diphosphorylase [Salinibacterium sp. NSLL35]MBH0101682.1 carboxylating nicotinate-nucleotide diphosphorylase [Salinibacterium sp. NSLL150]MBH0104441.1 carboxylating nicotinate-nucleotide diphosphorylase [Salinibacterium sp. NSLL16]MBH0107202.1 carboxylating nicotinate-nucleotide diphosphorylase [Salinibacterium sp. NSLL17]